MNKLIITGNLGHDPSMKEVNGKQVAEFSVGVQSGYGQNKTTIWYRVHAWEKKAELCKQYLFKGSKVLVIGEFSPKEYIPTLGKNAGTKQISLNVSATEIEFLNTKSEATAPGNQQNSAPPEFDPNDFTIYHF